MNENKLIRTVVYGRVSTQDQVSTKAQIDDIRRECLKNNEAVQAVIEEKKTSVDKKGIYDPVAYMRLRPKFYNEIYLPATRKEYDRLRIWKWDRFSRSYFQDILIQMFKDLGIEVLALRDSNEAVVRSVQGALSQEEVRKIRERVELRHQELLAHKRVLNRPPVGYRYNSKQELVPDVNADAIRKVFELTLKGYKAEEICNMVEITRKKKGSYSKAKLPLSSYYRIIHNKTYCGIYKFRGEERQGTYEKLIEPEVFEKVQNLLNKRNN